MKRISILAAAFFAFVAAGSVNAQSFDAPAVSQSTAAYEMGRYDEALASASKVVKDRNASASQRVEGFRLQGLAYAALGQSRKAQKAVDQMILLNPSYQGRTSDSPAFDTAVADAQRRYAKGDLKMGRKGPSQTFYNVVATGMSALTIYLGVTAAMAQ